MRGNSGLQRVPAAKDDDSERDESLPGDDRFAKKSHLRQHQVTSRHSRSRSRNQRSRVAHASKRKFRPNRRRRDFLRRRAEQGRNSCGTERSGRRRPVQSSNKREWSGRRARVRSTGILLRKGMCSGWNIAMLSGAAELPSALRYTVLATPSARTLNTSPATTWLARTRHIHPRQKKIRGDADEYRSEQAEPDHSRVIGRQETRRGLPTASFLRCRRSARRFARRTFRPEPRAARGPRAANWPRAT